MTKEEIQAQIDILQEYDLENFCEGLVEELEEQLQSAETIKDLERRSFRAGVRNVPGAYCYSETEIDAEFDKYIYKKK